MNIADGFAPVKRKDGWELVPEMDRPSTGYWKDARRRLKQNKAALGSFYIILLIFLAVVLGPQLSPYSYAKQNLIFQNTLPSLEHWFGTDNMGRDLLTRCLYGAGISLMVGVFATFISLTIGVLYGGIAGFMGGGSIMS